ALSGVVEALHDAGVPHEVLRIIDGGRSTLRDAARLPEVAFLATAAGPALARDAYGWLGPTPSSSRSLKALLSPLEGLQPDEPGFLRRFAWQKVVAVRTLRHGADLALEVARGVEGA
ncbi:MAG: hypothetical protein WD734_05665, partial [Dehalococcoidia bacterium]